MEFPMYPRCRSVSGIVRGCSTVTCKQVRTSGNKRFVPALKSASSGSTRPIQRSLASAKSRQLHRTRHQAGLALLADAARVLRGSGHPGTMQQQVFTCNVRVRHRRRHQLRLGSCRSLQLRPPAQVGVDAQQATQPLLLRLWYDRTRYVVRQLLQVWILK